MHPIKVEKTPKDSGKLNSKYLLDFYLKDFKYISPDVMRVHSTKGSNKDSKGETKACTVLAKVWVAQVVRGIKLLFSQGSLHGVKYIFEPTFSRKERATWIVIMVISIAICAANITQLFFKWTSTPFVNVIDSLPTPVYIFEPTFSRKERAAWIVIMVISIAICAANITQLFSKWTSTPFVNVIDSLPTPVWAVPFPTVVVCPHLHVKLSYKDVSEFNDLERFFAFSVCPHMRDENRALDKSLTAEESMMLEEFILEGSPKCTEIIKSCYWRATNDATWVAEECCAKLFQPVFTNYGLCFAFNSLPLNGMTNVTLPWQRTFNHKALLQTLNWGLDAGYPRVFPPDPGMQPFRVMASGEANGLGVELYLNASEHQVDCDGGSAGFNIIISSPTDHVYTSTIIRLPMDRMTTVEVYPITYKTDTSLRALLPERRQCFFQDERKLEYYDFYTDSNCKLDLLIREARTVCNCVYFNWPRKSPRDLICSTISDFRCINNVKAKVEEQLIYAYFADSEEQRSPSGAFNSCHPSCNDVLYNSQVFYSDLKTDPVESPKWGYPGPGEITRINVHFYDDSFLGQHRHAQYDDYYFVGAIGGLLSLFLGFSIISVAELVYFVILRPLHVVIMEICHRQRN